MPSFSQSTFLGSSVRSVSSFIGWNSESSRLVVSLVDDASNGDLFTPVEPGQPIYFQLGTYRFFGILKKWTRNKDIGNFPAYEVECSDPRHLLDATKIIIGQYSGPTYGVPNLINVYGFYENLVPASIQPGGLITDFGSAQVNDTGIPWKKVRDGLVLISNLPSYSDYGGPITYKGYTYSLDLSELPDLPNYFRIPADTSISVLDFIQMVCDYGGCDFFVELQGFQIKLRTVSRYTQPPLGTITTAVDSSDAIARNSNGLEERSEVTTAFLIGGQKHTLFKATSIETFWGFDINQNPIIGVSRYMHVYDAEGNYLGYSLVHRANLNASTVADILGQVYYTCDTYEMRAALYSKASWLEYIQKFRTNINQLIDGTALNGGEPRGNTRLPNDAVRRNINAVTQLNRTAAGQDRDGKGMSRSQRMYEFVRFYATNYMGRKYACRLPFVLHKTDAETGIVSHSYDIADAGYTEVQTLYVNGVEYDLEDDLDGLPTLFSDTFKTSDGRYTPFVYYANTTTADFSKLDMSSTILDNRRLYSKANVDDKLIFLPEPACVVTVNLLHELLDRTHGGLLLDDLMYRGRSIEYTETRIPPAGSEIVATDILDPITGEASYLPASIPYRITATGNHELAALNGRRGNLRGGLLTGGSSGWSSNLSISVNNGPILIEGTLNLRFLGNDPTDARLSLDLTVGGVGFDVAPNNSMTLSVNPYGAVFDNNFGEGLSIRIYVGTEAHNPHRRTSGGVISPNMHPAPIAITHAHIPLKSNILNYGPWYSGSTAGKVHLEHDSSMTPWNYGGYTYMDLAASAKVNSLVTNMLVSETGIIEESGIPSKNLGDLLESGGPNVTRINISFAEKGVTTSLSFETFIPRFGQMGKLFADRIRRTALISANLQREMRQKYKQLAARAGTIGEARRGAAANLLEGNLARNSPHTVFFMQNDIDEYNGVTYVRPMISTAKLEEALQGLNVDDPGDYSTTSAVDISALIRPITIFGSGSHVSPMDGPRGIWKERGLNSYWLNPLFANEEGHDFDILSYGTEYDGVNHYRENIGSTETITDFVALRGPVVITGHGFSTSGTYIPSNDNTVYTNSDLWKTGPVDLLWNENRKVWTCHDMVKGRVTQAITARTGSVMGSGRINIWKNFQNTHDEITVMNWFATAVPLTTFVQATFNADDNQYFLSGSDC